jgi:hypothetical protein
VGEFMIAWPPTRSKLALIGAGIAIAVLAAWVIISLGNSALDTAQGAGHDAGRAIERGEVLEQTIENVEKANDAASHIRSDTARWCELCLRDSRTPGACRYQLPRDEGFELCSAPAGAEGRPGQHR